MVIPRESAIQNAPLGLGPERMIPSPTEIEEAGELAILSRREGRGRNAHLVRALALTILSGQVPVDQPEALAVRMIAKGV